MAGASKQATAAATQQPKTPEPQSSVLSELLGRKVDRGPAATPAKEEPAAAGDEPAAAAAASDGQVDELPAVDEPAAAAPVVDEPAPTPLAAQRPAGRRARKPAPLRRPVPAAAPRRAVAGGRRVPGTAMPLPAVYAEKEATRPLQVHLPVETHWAYKMHAAGQASDMSKITIGLIQAYLYNPAVWVQLFNQALTMGVQPGELLEVGILGMVHNADLWVQLLDRAAALGMEPGELLEVGILAALQASEDDADPDDQPDGQPD